MLKLFFYLCFGNIEVMTISQCLLTSQPPYTYVYIAAYISFVHLEFEPWISSILHRFLSVSPNIVCLYQQELRFVYFLIF